MEDVKIPGEPPPTASPLIRNLTIVASGLTAASVAVNLILQIAHYSKKRPVQPDQRTQGEATSLALSVLKQAPGLIKQVRLLISQIKRPSDPGKELSK